MSSAATEDSIVTKRKVSGDKSFNPSAATAAATAHSTKAALEALLKPEDHKSLIVYKLTIYENVWRAVFTVLLLFAGFAVHKVYLFHTSPETAYIVKGHLSDFLVSIVSAIAIGVIRSSIRYFLLDRIIPLLSEKRSKSVDEGKKRADQLCKWLFDFIYYSSTSIAGYLIVKDQNFLPPSMFGTGECSKMFEGYPQVPHVPYLRLFLLIQAGTHSYTFVHQLVVKMNDPKFYEYALHHGLALFLIWFSYMMNFIPIGCIVLLLHDPGDVFLIATRAYTDMKDKKIWINAALFLTALPVWIYTRNIVLPGCVIRASFNQLMTPTHFDDILAVPMLYMFAMLSSLALMHVYWTFFFAKAALVMVFKGKDKNGYDS